MSHLRRFADNGVAMIVVSAVGAGRIAKDVLPTRRGCLWRVSAKARNWNSAPTTAFILTPDKGDDGPDATVTLRHLKSRHGEARGRLPRFPTANGSDSIRTTHQATPADKGKLSTALAHLWRGSAAGRTPRKARTPMNAPRILQVGEEPPPMEPDPPRPPPAKSEQGEGQQSSR